MFLTLSSPRYRTSIIVGLITVLLLGAGIAWALSRSGPAPESLGIVNVTALHTDVYIKNPDTDFVLVSEQATTSSGATIRTSASGRALIESSAAHRTLIDYSSEIALTEAVGNHTRAGLLGGAVWSRLEKVFDSGEYYEIKTGNAIAAVRGTSFGMWYSEGVTTLMVLEGSVVFSAVDPVTGDVIPGTEVLVSAGQKAVRDGNGKIVVTDLTNEDRARPWVLFNDSNESPGAKPAQPSTVVPQEPSGEATPETPAEAPSPELSIVSPSTIDGGSSERITIKGTKLEGVTQVRVGTKEVRFEVLGDTTISFWADDIKPGRYDITVLGAGNKSDTLSNALRVNEVVPPSGQYQPPQ